jgi:hypothetical protein
VAVGGTPSAITEEVSAGAVRRSLAALSDGSATTVDTAVWNALASKGALDGTRERTGLTEVGRQVLRELETRASRTDPLPLDRVAAEVGDGISSLAAMADTAEYFLSELGPVPPVEVVPLMRLAAAHLAVRRASPEQLVEEFTNGWGEAEVLGSTPADRLLAAELLTGSGAPSSEVYGAMMETCEKLVDAGCTAPVATAAILHLFPTATRSPPLERWTRARARVPSDEGAALLAGFPDLDATLERWTTYREAFGGDSADALRSAVYLAAVRPEFDPALVAATRDAAARLRSSFASPLLAAAVALTHLGLSPEESVDWHAKSVAQAGAHRLAPDDRELAALGLAFVGGLDAAGFAGRSVDRASTLPASGEAVLARTAVHAWIYRPLVAKRV